MFIFFWRFFDFIFGRIKGVFFCDGVVFINCIVFYYNGIWYKLLRICYGIFDIRIFCGFIIIIDVDFLCDFFWNCVVWFIFEFIVCSLMIWCKVVWYFICVFIVVLISLCWLSCIFNVFVRIIGIECCCICDFKLIVCFCVIFD